MTSLKAVYDAFFNQITDDMYVTMTKEEVERDCFGLLLGSLPLFEFPDKIIDIVTTSNEMTFSRDLTLEEINILAVGMIIFWLQRQITSIELTRQKFTGQDFKLTSQAAHLNRLISLQTTTKEEHRRLQMLCSRRRRDGEQYVSNFDLFVKPIK